jgi:hypothetical protein
VPLLEYFDTPGTSSGQTAVKKVHDLQDGINNISSGKLLSNNRINECMIRSPYTISLSYCLIYVFVCLLLYCISASSRVDGHESRGQELNNSPVFHLKRRESNGYEDELEEDTAACSTPSRSSIRHWEGKNEWKYSLKINDCGEVP